MTRWLLLGMGTCKNPGGQCGSNTQGKGQAWGKAMCSQGDGSEGPPCHGHIMMSMEAVKVDLSF